MSRLYMTSILSLVVVFSVGDAVGYARWLSSYCANNDCPPKRAAKVKEKHEQTQNTQEQALDAQVVKVVQEGKDYWVTLVLSRPTQQLDVLIYDKTQTFIIDHKLKTTYLLTRAVGVGANVVRILVSGPKVPGDHFGIVEVRS